MGDDIAWMQIYGQTYWHMPAEIRGNEVALTALRDAINMALKEKTAMIEACSSDGEGYALWVHVTSEQELDELPNHYTHEIGRTQWDRGYQYASDQLMPMIRSLQERLRKLEGRPLKKDKLMEEAEK